MKLNGLSKDTCEKPLWFLPAAMLVLWLLLGLFARPASALTCSDCHGYPPADDSTRNPSTGAFPGSHDTHAGTANLNLACTVCHVSNTLPGHRNGQIEMTNPVNGDPGASYSKGTSFLQTNATFTGGTCNTVYCHSSGQNSTGGALTASDYSAPRWGSSSTGACGTCHKVTEAAGLASGSHTIHLGTPGVNGCSDCHSGAADDASSYISANHVDRTIDVTDSYTAGGMPGNGYGTCSTAACHADVYGPTTSVTPTWGTMGNGCNACHSAKPIATVGPDTGSHTKHNLTNCGECHAGATNSTTTPTLNHADGDIDVTDGYPVTAKHAPGTYTGTCSTASCHADVYGAGTAPTPTWGTTDNGCNACHSAKPITTVGPDTGSHTKHNVTNCADCHAGATNYTTTPTMNHADGDIDATNGYPATAKHAPGAYTGTCSTASCHADVYGPATTVTPTWGVASGCNACHSAKPITALGPDTGSHTKHMNMGGACTDCHNAGTTATAKPSTEHADTLIDTTGGHGYADEKSKGTPFGTCATSYCHGATINGPNTIPAWGAAAGSLSCSGVPNGACHDASNANAPTLGSHTRHAGNLAGQLVLACASCHGSSAGASGHVGGNVGWSLDTANARIGSGATYSGTAIGATGTRAPSSTYRTCATVYCHSSVQSNPGTGAPASYASPAWGAASVTCDSCHGQGTGVNNGAPSTGSHEVHVTTYSYTCAVCHAGLGDEVASHTDGTINLSFDAATAGSSATYTVKGTSFAPRSAAFQACFTTKCHGDDSDTSAEAGAWGTSLSASDACTVCHGTKTAGADGSAAATLRAPGGNATGVDTSGTIGTITRNVSNDPEVGAHDAHLRGLTNISNAIACSACHTVPAVSVAGIKGHLDGIPADMTFSGLSTTNGAPAAFNAGSHTCSNVYCHNESYFTTSNHANGGTGTAPVWNNINYFADNAPPLTSTECGRCHFYDGSNCSSCHYVSAAGDFVNADNLSFAAANKGLHVDGGVTAKVTCVGCHSSGLGTRRQIAGTGGEFGLAWGHHDNTVTDADCVVCHMEGTSVANPVRSASHQGTPGGTVDLRDPDLGTAIPNATAVFSRNLNSATLEAFVTSIQNNHCLKCHDSNGANYLGAGQAGTDGTHTPSNPFVTGVAPLNVDAHFNSTVSVHPVKTAGNNTYCSPTTMVAPWNQSAGTHNLITCFDCHAADGATGTQNSTVVAHGGAATLRAAYDRTAQQPTALCIACHKSSTYWTGTTAPAGSAFSTAATTGDTETHPNTAGTTSRHVVSETFFNGCIACHSSAGSNAAQPARPRAAEDTHGFNTLVAGGNWTAITPATNGSPPFAFFRATNAITSWRPRDWTGRTGTAPTAGSCNGTNMCGRGEATYAYQPGGVY